MAKSKEKEEFKITHQLSNWGWNCWCRVAWVTDFLFLCIGGFLKIWYLEDCKRLKSPDIKTWMVSLLKHFSWMFAKVFLSGKLFAEVLILCKTLKWGFPQGIILLFSFIFLLMPPINHELLQRCQRAACLSDCKWQVMNNAHRSRREALKPTACCLWALACCQTIRFSGAWFLPDVRWALHWTIIRNPQPWVSAQNTWFQGSRTPLGNLEYQEGTATPKRMRLQNSRESSQSILTSARLKTPWGQSWFPTMPRVVPGS